MFFKKLYFETLRDEDIVYVYVSEEAGRQLTPSWFFGFWSSLRARLLCRSLAALSSHLSLVEAGSEGWYVYENQPAKEAQGIRHRTLVAQGGIQTLVSKFSGQSLSYHIPGTFLPFILHGGIWVSMSVPCYVLHFPLTKFYKCKS